MRRSKSTNFIPSYSYIEEDENPQDLLRAYRMVLRDLRFVQGEVASLQEQLEKQQEESSQWTIRYTRRMVLLSNLLLGGFIFGDRCIDIMKDLVSAHSGAVWTTLWRRGKQKISTIGGGGSSSSSSASSSSSSHLGNASGFGFNMGTSSHGASGGGTFSSFGSRRAISSSSNNNNNGNSNAATGGRFSTLANNFNNTFSNNLNTLLSMTSIPSSHNNNITSGTRRHFLTAARSGSGGSSSSSQHHHHHSGGGGGSGSGSGSSLLYSHHHHHHGSRPRYVIRDVMYKGLLSASLRSSIFFLAAYWITSKDRWKRGCGIVLSLLGSLYMAFRSKIAPWAIYFNICTIALYLIVRFYKYVPFLHLL